MLSNAGLPEFASWDRVDGVGSERLACLESQNRQLAPYASHIRQSRGRHIYEEPCAQRSPFARDRDRIVHSTAFRRLTYKTQVFITHEGDHYRNRLTHSLEVAQIARSLARQLLLDEDLVEAISLAHDIGHPPFGHAGERALNRALSAFGGFDHNIQTLRVVTKLEKRYATFDGLNLTWECLEGLIKHNGPLLDPRGRGAGEYSGLELPAMLRQFDKQYDFNLQLQSGPEAQVAALADDIAYNNHDIDDGLRAGLLSIDDLEEIDFVWEIVEDVRATYGKIEDCRLVHELSRRLIARMIGDVLAESARRLTELAPRESNDIRQASRPTIAFSPAFALKLEVLRNFLYSRVYRNERVMRVMDEAERVIEDLAGHYMNQPQDLPSDWGGGSAAININECAGRIRDYIAGATDRYALDLHRSLFDVSPKLR